MLALTSWLFVPALLAGAVLCCGYFKGKSWFWVLFFLAFFYLGAGFAGQNVKVRRERDNKMEIISKSYGELEGRIHSLEEKEGNLTIVLKEVKAGGFSFPGFLFTIEAAVPPAALKGAELRIGQIVKGKGQFRSFSPARNPGEFDSKAYYEAMGISGRMFGEEIEIINSRHSPVLEALRQAKEWGKKRLSRFAGEDAPLFQAAVLGDKSGLSKDVKALYQKNGIAHLLAISGLHMSFLGLLF